MPLPRTFFQPAFRHRRLGAFMAVIVAVMVYMATFVTAAEASLAVMTLAWNRDLTSRMTVEIPAVDDEASMPQAERVKQALSVLRAMPGITHVVSVPADDASRLLSPWITDAELLRALPIPSLIDLERLPGSNVTADSVRQQLKPTLRDVRVDDHSVWMADLARFVDGIAAFGAMMVVLSGLTLVLAVSIVCRAIMATEKDTISLLHVMGAEDNDIAAHFQIHARRIARSVAVMGFLFAVFSAGILMYFLRHFSDPLLLQPVHWAGIAALILSVPLMALWIISVSARQSVLGFLRTMP